jgi:hypothetical protein
MHIWINKKKKKNYPRGEKSAKIVKDYKITDFFLVSIFSGIIYMHTLKNKLA